MADMMTFPETVEEFMEQYKITDTKQIYTNGTELIPIFRMKQWFEHKPERKTARWEEHIFDGIMGGRPRALMCTQCNYISLCVYNFCPQCGAKMLDER